MSEKCFGILGLGITGKAVLDFLSDQNAKIYVIDDNLGKRFDTLEKSYEPNVKFHFGKEFSNIADRIDTLIVSPGISLSHPIVQEVAKRKKEVIGEIELAYRNKGNEYIIGVTGTNGKTTTTLLITEILHRAGKKVVPGGNIGTPFISLIRKNYEYIVLEVSSFQLETIHTFKPDMALFLNISEDHLDRHKDMDTYFNIKKRIFKNQCRKDIAILNQDYPMIRSLKEFLLSRVFLFGRKREYEDTYAYIKNNRIIIEGEMGHIKLDIDKFKVSGAPFLYNVMAASLSAYLLGIDRDVIKEVVYHFSPLPHRMEMVGTVEGRVFINDSKATNPDAVFWALSSFEGKIILIMGGKDKDLSFKKLIPLLKKKVKVLILTGEAREKLKRELDFPDVFLVDSVKEAVNKAFELSDRGDVILFSPGCTSWDRYKNYEERGDDFKKWVKNLREGKGEVKRT